MTHVLKVSPEEFEALVSHLKEFEIRKDDRNFQVGDTLELRERDPKKGRNTGKVIFRRIRYKIKGRFGLPPDICVMQLE